MEIPYTRDRSGFQSQIMGWGILLLVEALAVVTLILVFAPAIWLKLLLIGALAGLLTWLFGWILPAPARTRHALDDDTLHLRYGRSRIDIPRSRIARAEASDDRSGPAFVSQPEDDEARGLVRVTFSRQGQILLHLDPPLELPRKKGVFMAREVLFNADDREAVLAALDRETASAPLEPARTSIAELMPTPIGTRGDHEAAIEAVGLAKRYGERVAIDDLTVRVEAGEIYGFIGPNGAGKTTTLSMLVGLLAPTEGIVRIAGHDLTLNPVAAKRALGYVPDRPVVYDTLTGRENLEFVAQMRGLPVTDTDERIDALLETLQLRDRAGELARSWSFGMRNKLSLAMAMLHRPEVLILDEPFNGLDPQTSHSLRTLIIEQARQGAAVLLSTHDLALVERMCHRVGVIDRGRLIAEGDPAMIREQAEDLEAAFLALIGGGARR